MAFVIRKNLRPARALILERQGKYGEAIKQYFEDDQVTSALDVFLRHIKYTSRDAGVMDIIMTFLWRHLSFGRRTWKKSTGVQSNKILRLLDAVLDQDLGERENYVASGVFILVEGRLILIAQIGTFRLILQKYMSPSPKNDLVEFLLDHHGLDKAIELLALDYLFDDLWPILNCSSRSDAISALRLFHRYSALIKEIVLNKTPWKLPWVCALFQVKEHDGQIQVIPATFLYEGSAIAKNRQSTDQPEVLLSRVEFGDNLRRLLSERLHTHVMTADNISSGLSIFDPGFLCASRWSDGKGHEGYSASHQVGDSWFSQRLRFHLLRIIILDNLHAISRVDGFRSRIRAQRCGIAFLFLFPLA